MKHIFYLALAAIYTLAVLCIGRCSAGDVKAKITLGEAKVLKDTIYIPQPVPAEAKRIEVPAEVDTAAILQQFYTQNVYRRPVIDTKLLQVNLVDTVYNNVLIGSTATYTMRIPQHKHDLSVGVLAGFNTFSLMGTYRYDRLGMSAGYDFINKSLVMGVQYRLFRW